MQCCCSLRGFRKVVLHAPEHAVFGLCSYFAGVVGPEMGFPFKGNVWSASHNIIYCYVVSADI